MADLTYKKAQQTVSIVDKTSGDSASVTTLGQLKVLSTLSGTTGSIKSQAQTITTTAAKVPATPLTGRNTLTIQNLGPKLVYIGDSTVTSSNGLELPVGGIFNVDIADIVDIYALTSVSTSEVRVFETS